MKKIEIKRHQSKKYRDLVMGEWFMFERSDEIYEKIDMGYYDPCRDVHHVPEARDLDNKVMLYDIEMKIVPRFKC